MRKVDLLRELQRLDLALDERRERLEVVRQQLADRAELDQAMSAREESLRSLRKLEVEQTDLELKVGELRDKLKGVDDKLYGGSVRNPKELDGLAKEADHLHAAINQREDRLLEYFEQVEQAASAARSAGERFEQVERDWRQRHEALESELAQLRSEIGRLEIERDQIRSRLDSASLRVYDGLRRTRGGLAVVEVRQRTCQGCRISLPLSEEVRARSSADLVLCQSCGRILSAGV